jgi:hypothetical protein
LQLTLGETLAAIGGIRDSVDHTRQGLAILRKVAAHEQGSTQALTRIAETFLIAKPAALQDHRFALECVETAIARSAGSLDPSAGLLKARVQRRLGREEDAVCHGKCSARADAVPGLGSAIDGRAPKNRGVPEALKSSDELHRCGRNGT